MKIVLFLLIILSLFMWRRHQLGNRSVIYATMIWLLLIVALLLSFVLHPTPLLVLSEQRILIMLILIVSILGYAVILYTTFSMTMPSKQLIITGWCGLALSVLALGWFKWLIL